MKAQNKKIIFYSAIILLIVLNSFIYSAYINQIEISLSPGLALETSRSASFILVIFLSSFVISIIVIFILWYFLIFKDE